jgi:hypothetical protein
MKLCNRYNIPESTIQNMVKDGVISNSWPLYEEIYALYLSLKNPGKSKSSICREISDSRNMSEHTVRAIVSKMDKI